jgi:ssRNA-specific RNase YbeY (16S rRNA maturation enzyme)
LRTPPAARIRRLLIHGFLHLLGYDHERSAAEARKMFARERALANKISKPCLASMRRKTPTPRKVSARRKSL